MEELGVLTERVRNNEKRIEANHDSLAFLRGSVAKQDVRIAVISSDIEDIREDVGEIKGQLKWVLRGLWAAAATFLMTAVGLATLIVSLSGGG